jgi:hypothetical protein
MAALTWQVDAKQMGQALPDAEEREIFEAAFCRVPVPA